MRSRLVVLAVAVAASLSFAGIAIAGGKPMETTMSGAEEAPNPGDPIATGFTSLTFNKGAGQVCFNTSWAQIHGTVFAAHIHRGAAGAAGPIVVPLFVSSAFPGLTGTQGGCINNVDPELIQAICRNPTAYYVNVHSTPNYPGGAIRGQLGD